MSSQNTCYHDQRMEFFYNISKQTEDWEFTHLIALQCVGCIFSCFILVSNAMVILAVITNNRFHNAFYYLVANLAASDFLAGIAYVYLMFNTGSVSKTLSVQKYFLRQGLLDTSLSASLTNLLVIALERYISIMNWKVHSSLTKRRVTLLIVLVWVISIFMGAVPSMGWNCICNIEQCSMLAPIFSRSYLIFWSLFNLGVFLIMVAIYLRIYAYVRNKTTVLNRHATGSLKRKKTPIKLIKTVMTVLGRFQLYFLNISAFVSLSLLTCLNCTLLGTHVLKNIYIHVKMQIQTTFKWECQPCNKWIMYVIKPLRQTHPSIKCVSDNEKWQQQGFLCVDSWWCDTVA